MSIKFELSNDLRNALVNFLNQVNANAITIGPLLQGIAQASQNLLNAMNSDEHCSSSKPMDPKKEN